MIIATSAWIHAQRGSASISTPITDVNDASCMAVQVDLIVMDQDTVRDDTLGSFSVQLKPEDWDRKESYVLRPGPTR
mgnify:CR=1 FL=1